MNKLSLRKVLYEYDRGLYRLLFSPSRRCFLCLLLEITFCKKNVTFLDVYPILGSIAIDMSDRVQSLCMVSKSPNILSLLKKSCHTPKNVNLVMSDLQNLPFKGKVDIIFLNNFPKNRLFPKKRNGQKLNFLKKLYDALNEDGVLVFGVRNLCFPSYRSVNSIFFKENGGFYYYCKKIMKKAGFSHVAIFGSYPNYILPQYVYSLENTKAINFLSRKIKNYSKLEKLFFKIICKSLRLARLCSPSFIVFAFKGGNNFSEYFAGDLVLSGHDIYTKCFKIFDLEKNVVVKVLKSKYFSETFKNEVRIRTSGRVNAPNLLVYDEFRGFMIEKLVDGETLEHIYDKNPLGCLRLISKAFDVLIDYYNSQNFSYLTLYDYLTELIKNLSRYQEIPILRPYISDFIETYKQITNSDKTKRLLEKKIPILQIHGDFNLKNIMYCKNKDKIFLIDWESTRTSNAFHDFFTFIINNLKWSEVKNVINLEPKGATERHMLGVLKNKYVNWFEYDANFMRTMALITLIEKTLYYSPFLLEDAALYEAIDDIKGIYTLRRKLEL